MVIHQCQMFVESSCISVAFNVFISILLYKQAFHVMAEKPK